MHRNYLLALLSVGLLASCASEDTGTTAQDCGERCDGAISAICELELRGKGMRDLEVDYLPNVLACENGGGSLESLKALAISARSFAYYKIRDEKVTLRDGQSDQVYSCGKVPTALHEQAVKATSGRILRYERTYVAGFHLAGALQSGPTCQGGTTGPYASTEERVTYNENLSGHNINQSTAGWPNKENYANRGCLSQNGANCLADEGMLADEIIRFYYGADIEVVQTVGDCVVPGDYSDDTTGEAWVGHDCAYDRSICDFTANGQASECIEWYDDGPSQALYGFCSIECEGFCPNKGGEPSSFCAEIDQDKGHCTIAPSTENDHCTNIAGTEPLVVKRWVGDSGAKETYKAVCAPPGGRAIECSPTNSPTGECIDTDSMQCDGNLRTGFCPGGANIVCCSP